MSNTPFSRAAPLTLSFFLLNFLGADPITSTVGCKFKLIVSKKIKHEKCFS